MSTGPTPYSYQPTEGEVRWMGVTATRFLATRDLTFGAFALVDEQSARGISVPLHRHVDDEESFYVLEGEISFFVGDQRVRGSAGTFVHVPAGAVHGFRVESDAARYLIITTPHHADFYRAISLPTPGATIDDAALGAACREYGIEFVGPLPT